MREGYLVQIGTRRYWTGDADYETQNGAVWLGDGTLQKVSPVRQGAGAAFPKYSVDLLIHKDVDKSYFSADIGPVAAQVMTLKLGDTWVVEETFNGVLASWAMQQGTLKLVVIHRLEWQTTTPVVEYWNDSEQRTRYPAAPGLAQDRAFARAALMAELARIRNEWPN